MHDHTTHGIVHAGFGGLRRFVARIKVRCSRINNYLVLPTTPFHQPLYNGK